jgi:hypothetical protein
VWRIKESWENMKEKWRNIKKGWHGYEKNDKKNLNMNIKDDKRRNKHKRSWKELLR